VPPRPELDKSSVFIFGIIITVFIKQNIKETTKCFEELSEDNFVLERRMKMQFALEVDE
jgi:hypothetical protein